jgi:hypothetical protein
MPVNIPIKDYEDNSYQWSVVRDCVEGEVAIKREGVKYLPMLPNQSEADYAAYQARPKFFDGTSRTAEGLHGQIFAKDPVQNGEISEAFKELLKNVDASGMEIDQFASNTTWDAMQAPWGGILVDHPPVPEGVSKAESHARAYLKWYEAEAVINWRYSIENGVSKLTLVVLREDMIEQNPDDEFEVVITEAYRVLSFDKDGYYIQRLFVKFEGAENAFAQSEPLYARIDGEKLREIPFFTCPGEEPEKSMLLGLAFENIGHYQKSADYENGLHFTGVPSPIVENMRAPKDENGKAIIVKLGGTRFQFFCGEQGQSVNVKFLEFSGAGLGQLRLAMNDSLERMAKLGIKALGEEKKAAETSDTASIHRSAENGLLGAFARNMSDKITQAVRLMAKWNNIAEADSWSYELNNRFDYKDISNQILQIIHNARMSGELPRSVWFTFLKKYGILQEELHTFDDFLLELEKDKPLLLPGPSEEDDERDIDDKDGAGLKDNRS